MFQRILLLAALLPSLYLNAQPMDNTLTPRRQGLAVIAALEARGDQAGLETALAEALEGGLTVSEAKEAETLEALKADGINIIEVPDKTPWVEAVKDVVTANINGEDAAYQAILGMK